MGGGIYYRIIDATPVAIEGAGNYFCLVLLICAEFQLPLAYRADQNVHEFSFHGGIIACSPSIALGRLINNRLAPS